MSIPALFAHQNEGGAIMSEANKAATRRFFKALGSGDVVTLKTLVTEDVEAITPGTANISGTRNYDVVMQLAEAF